MLLFSHVFQAYCLLKERLLLSSDLYISCLAQPGYRDKIQMYHIYEIQDMAKLEISNEWKHKTQQEKDQQKEFTDFFF